MRSRPTSRMKKGWLCRTSYDEIVYPWWWPVEIQIELWSRSSYDDSERSRSSDDPDPAVVIQIEWWSRSSPEMMIQIEWWSRSSREMIQIEWWSRSSDSILWWSRSRDDPDPDDLKTKMTWRQDDLKTKMTQRWRWSSWCREEDQCWKNCVERIPS